MANISHNFLPQQYSDTNPIKINHNYLQNQFADYADVFKKLEVLLKDGDFTLGKAVDEFENRVKEICGTKYAVGVGSGTDALFLSLKALGVDKGDEVITTPYTFFATVGAIVTAGARPVFADVGPDYNIDPAKIEAAITPKTKAILPVHWAGLICDMDPITAIAKKNKLAIVEDACHALRATYKGRSAGSFGESGCFSMHPLKNLNVWGDGGFMVTNSDMVHERMVLRRNHGLINRDECAVFAYNSRLDTLQAIVANHCLDTKLDNITAKRIRNANLFDERLKGIAGIKVPPRYADRKQVYHLYIVRAERRDELQKFLISKGVDAKVHYPIPMHLQPAAKDFGYKAGDFPVAEKFCKSVISFPVHEFVTEEQVDFMAEKVKEFYS
jgi:dTDP-3-amino-2,3,6-trideoxy-4-keto-D-glucose/dTDP-3-amino-3,4,6-trideoxy-alpha-D-glucose/dTDP-2,6-dideoxy-D-kanosamine transaminase